MAVSAKYRQFISEFTRQQMIILGPNLATDAANRVDGLEVNSRGQVVDMVGDEVLITQAFLNEFLKLSPPLTSYVAHSLFDRFPEIEEQNSGKFSKVQLTCTLMKPKA